MAKPLKFKMLSGLFCIHKLEADAEIPNSVLKEKFVWIGRTEDELSIVCRSQDLISKEKDSDWICLQVDAVMSFDLVGVIASISEILASHQIPIFCISTFNTDYILIKKENVSAALEALKASGHSISE